MGSGTVLSNRLINTVPQLQTIEDSLNPKLWEGDTNGIPDGSLATVSAERGGKRRGGDRFSVAQHETHRHLRSDRAARVVHLRLRAGSDLRAPREPLAHPRIHRSSGHAASLRAHNHIRLLVVNRLTRSKFGLVGRSLFLKNKSNQNRYTIDYFHNS